MGDPLEKLRLLGARIEEVASKMGLEVVGFGVLPGPDAEAGADFVDIAFRIHPSALKDPEQRKIDMEFMALMEDGLTDSDADEKLEQLKESLKDWNLEDG